jgi:nitroreductase
MKRLLFICFIFTVVLTSGAADESAFSTILNNFGARNYVPGTIPQADIEKIVSAGVRAPSASNRQPWRFIVVTDSQLVKKIMGNAPDGNVFIVVTANSSAREVLFDCALATENIYLAAQALGYGSRIYTGLLGTVNGSLKSELGIQQGIDAVAVVRVGRLAPDVDAVSSASARKPAGSTVTYK